ncbi:cytochrome P450 [Conidiobolus coronatus NRRL 28638]|uniref:Cytochrome P450 n=1 Tax=Conidiobolus coronatus (strain ATCC 28846 / CBS 209.66 / NRRL 28638) TaxID=796925 RepID=A0A137P9B6_CONC2|nr:cytochrome P450 [Conidiobolus coronatus NRRL 28638]|eukprot:KXN71593.1 cytochrome P450 [Conidiobolus coronatus NRRL 28638]
MGASKDAFDDEMAKHMGPMLDKHGIVRYFGPHGWSIIIADPQLAKIIYNNSDVFYKNTNSVINLNPHSQKFFGKDQIVNINGEDWKRMRKLMNPIFHQTWPIDTLSKCTRDVIDIWSQTDGLNVEVHDNIQKLTLDVLGHTVFNTDFESVKNPDSELYNRYHTIAKDVFGQIIYFFFPILDKVPYFKRPKLQSLISSYDKYVFDMVTTRREELKLNPDSKAQDLLSKLVLASEEDGKTLISDREIADNLKAFFIAGHDTTSSTLAATFYYLARYPEVQDKLRTEILEVMNNPQVLTNPTLEQLKQMDYLNMVIKESMRRMATVSIIERVSNAPFNLTNTIYLPAKTPVFILPWQTHQQSQYFSNPKEFNPERFRDPSSVESKNWQPFITGPRACIGMTLSLMEQRVSLVLLLQKFIFSIDESNPDYKQLRLTTNGIIRPRDLRLNLTQRI